MHHPRIAVTLVVSMRVFREQTEAYCRRIKATIKEACSRMDGETDDEARRSQVETGRTEKNATVISCVP
jgi:hypothetical protein